MPAATPQRLKFIPAMHIKQGRDFSRVRKEGQRLVLGCLIANWLALPEGEEKKSALADIKNRWQSENWCDEPNGKSAKLAKAIYEQH